eukprot:gnl/TRDRNA2_/TRDRNA2_129085_c1_seq2.p1 gnl/TRDRNA2_/TRDRNA2_129085_c1~~gnl/TRDRNA2_/TRDRNA2_129085_c1_seq2.p1  ORF type:complete len:792 (+),score=110.02 gnl/TRDRNA2_/TRDRNA2_129085_c1_seq2:301-2376(+)
MDAGGCGLLEAPTGTGKTLAVLGTALAWQWSKVEEPTSDRVTDSDASAAPPRVLWVARTHEQLLHAVHELRRLPYRPMMSLRLSRERFCLLPTVRSARNKAEACEIATTISPQMAAQLSKGAKGFKSGKGGKSGNGGKGPQPSGCSYLEHAEAIGYPQAPEYLRRFELSGPLSTYDIEDLVREAQDMHICPYHTVGDLSMEGAGLIFITYSQLLDPLVRFAGGYEPLLQDAVIAVDEAHNLADAAREVASFSATASELEEMRSHFEELALKLPGDDVQKIVRRLLAAATRLRSWLLGAASTAPELRPLDVGPPGVHVAGGAACFALIKHCGLESVKQVDRDIRDLKRLRKDLMWAGLESTAVRSAAVNELEAFLWKMRFVLGAGGSDDYRLVVEPHRRVQFLCLRGAVALEPAMKPAHSLLLLSGTLSPFDVLIHELGLDGSSVTNPGPDVKDAAASPPRTLFRCQAPHHTGLDQMCIARAVGAVGRTALDSRYKSRSEAYLDAVGQAVLVLCSAIPNGTVVFLPSHALLEALLVRLRASGCYAALQAGGRCVFAESRGPSHGEALASYRAAAVCGPATLFAVMRGRTAEGVDLRDAEARGCLVVGVPFPQLSIEVELRRRAAGGSRWYEAEAMRQVSQAAGRLIRHQKDFGALVLLDRRFTSGQPSTALAPWLRGSRSGRTGCYRHRICV